MKNIFRALFKLVVVFVILSGVSVFAAEPIRFEFNQDMEGWDIPDWAFEQGNYVGKAIDLSTDAPKKGDKALEIMCDFPGDVWTAAIIEFTRDLNLEGYSEISVDVFLPKKAKGDIYQVRIILVVGPWWWMEQRESVFLRRNRWTTVKAKLDVNMANELLFWKRKTKEASLTRNLSQVRKIAIRIECNVNQMQESPEYDGPIYIDNIVIK